MLTGEKLGPEIISELCRYSPSEVLFNAAILDYKEVTAYIKQQLACSVELLDEAAFAPDACMEEMRAQFGDAPEKTAGLAPESPAFTALAVLLGYLKETQKKGVERLKTVHNYAEAQYMQLSPVTRANLELTETMRGREKKGTLLWVLDKTQTAMGKRLMARVDRAASGERGGHQCASGRRGGAGGRFRSPRRYRGRALKDI